MRHRLLPFVALHAVCLAGCNTSPSQPTPVCTFTLSSTSVSAPAEGATGTLTVATGSQCTWTSRAEVGWISVVSGASGTGPGSVAYSVSANADTVPRTGSLTIAGHTVVVSQQGQLPCTYALTPPSRTFDAVGGPGTIDVAAPAHCEWSATSGIGWVSVVAGGQGIGNGTVSYVTAANFDTASRMTTVTVGTATHGIAQAGVGTCPVALLPDHEVFPASGGQTAFDVTAASGCAWLARSTAGWVQVTAPPGGLGTGSQRVSYSVDGSGAPDARTATIVVGPSTYLITQAGARPCEYTVTPVEFRVCLSGGERTITVDTGTACTWAASAGSPWLSIVSGQSGFGAGTIRFTFTGNYAAAREGTIAVRWPSPTQGQNVRVLQAGCLYAVTPDSIDVPAAGGDVSFDVYASPTDPVCGGPLQDACVWRAESPTPWVTVLTTMPRNGDDRVRLRVGANGTGSSRSATVTAGTRTVLIRQAGV